MSGKLTSKFDAAIEALNDAILGMSRWTGYRKEKANCRAAIRVLEAAAKVDKERAKLIVIEGHPPLYEREKWDIYKQVLALLESLPEDSK